jgi:hypothetical protein
MVEQHGQDVVDEAQEIVEAFSKQIEDNGLAGVIAANIFFQAFLEQLNETDIVEEE